MKCPDKNLCKQAIALRTPVVGVMAIFQQSGRSAWRSMFTAFTSGGPSDGSDSQCLIRRPSVIQRSGKEISIDFKLMFVYHGSMMVLFIGGAKPLGPSRDQDPNT